jgi:hypothetical protein
MAFNSLGETGGVAGIGGLRSSEQGEIQMRIISFAMAIAMGLAASPATAAPSMIALAQSGVASTVDAPAERWGVLDRFIGMDLVCDCDPKRVWLLRLDDSGTALRIVGSHEYGTTVVVFQHGVGGRGTAESYWAEKADDGTLVPLVKGGKVGGIDLTPAKFDMPWSVDADGALTLDGGTERKPYFTRYRIAGDRLILESSRGKEWKPLLEMREFGPADAEAQRLVTALRPYVGSAAARTVAEEGARVPVGVALGASEQPTSSGDATIPTLEIGEEVGGMLANGHRGIHGQNVPVAAYRFQGEKGQRICARVVSPDSYMHVYLTRSLEPGTKPLYTSWLPDYTDLATPPPYRPEWRHLANKQPDGFSATLPASGEYVVYAMAHEARQEFNPLQNFERLQYSRERPASVGGSYELKLWDADHPEPASALPGQQARQHAHAGGPVWLGDIGHMIGQPWINEQKGVIYTYSVRNGMLVHAARSLETNRPVYEWQLAPTGRRGLYRTVAQDVSLDVQCDGSWIVSGPGGEDVHYRYFDDGLTGPPSVSMTRTATPLFAHRPSTGARAVFDGRGLLVEVTDDSLDYAMGAIERRQREEADYQAWQAELAAAESAAMSNAMGAFVQGMSDATRSNQAMQQSMEDARDRGLAEGALEYARRQAEQARQDAEQRQADVDHARQVREGEEAARQARAAEAQAAEARRAEETERAEEAQRQVASNDQRSGAGNQQVDGGDASTLDDPMTCVTSPQTRTLAHRKDALEAYVHNRCDYHVDIVLCLHTGRGWGCGVKMGTAPGDTMVWELGGADGQTYMDAKPMGATRPLGRP